MTADQALTALEQLGLSGFTVSICCGPSGAEAFAWSVLVMAPTGESFDQPFAARSFQHALEIAHMEIGKRHWTSRQ